MRYFASNEQLVQRLSESYFMRKLAQITWSTFSKTKTLAEEKLQVQELSPEKFRSFIQAFRKNVKSEIENAKQEIKDRNKK